MKIENYSFGKMTIDGKTFISDLLIVNESILPEWWRAQGHGLSMNDIVCILQINIKTFVLGCGFSSTLTA
ncbi:MAG: hypothetical protein KAI43_09880 [Candidatus Aureabacteria bacterium]|nr:hypothetical protein [Candidatus Auribacterota bacterium]